MKHKIKTARLAILASAVALAAVYFLSGSDERSAPKIIASVRPSRMASEKIASSPMAESPAMTFADEGSAAEPPVKSQEECSALAEGLREEADELKSKHGGADTEIAAAVLGWRAADLARCAWPTPETMSAAVYAEAAARQAWALTGHLPIEPMQTVDFDEIKNCSEPPCGFRMTAMRPPTSQEIEAQEKARPGMPNLRAQVAHMLLEDRSERAHAWREAFGLPEEGPRPHAP